MALWKMQSAEEQDRTRVCNSSIDDAVCTELIGQFEAAEVDPLIWDVTSDLGMPAFRVLIFDRWAQSELAVIPVAFGAGAHPERGVALTRALTEAAQSRLTLISGARDDFARRMYEQWKLTPEAVAEYARLIRTHGERDWKSIPNRPFSRMNDSLSWLLDRLERENIQICSIPLSPEGAPLQVARTLAVGLEGPSSSPSWTPGARAQRIAA
jgi:ribosomal protein S12 methylthiotransferase accessory factor